MTHDSRLRADNVIVVPLRGKGSVPQTLGSYVAVAIVPPLVEDKLKPIDEPIAPPAFTSVSPSVGDVGP